MEERLTTSQIVDRSQKKIYHPPIKLLFRRLPPNESLYPAIKKAADDMGVTIPEYCRIVAFDRLKADGYLLESDEYVE